MTFNTQTITLYLSEPARIDYAKELAQQFNLHISYSKPNDAYYLNLDAEKLQLKSTQGLGDVWVDFVEGSNRHRRQFGGGAGQPVAKAIGLKTHKDIKTIIDTTAGLGGDSFVFASLGLHVTLLERSNHAAALLFDGLERAKRDPDTTEIARRMHLIHTDSRRFLQEAKDRQTGVIADVIFIDPMFPEPGKKSAQVKKEMQAFHQVIGEDLDSAELLLLAQYLAKKRVVVKRPQKGAYLGNQKPSASLDGKSTRFDLYAPIKVKEILHE